jgi:hypothetical protein
MTLATGLANLTPLPSAGQGLCTLSWQDRVFTFRTNPNEIWWDYELITHTEETYGGRVVQILGLKLGDLSVKIECGGGGWDYLMMVVNFLRDLVTAQRGGQHAEFAYTTRGWRLGVYAISVPFGDQVTATTREILVTFKIQQDITGLLSQGTLDVELSRITAGIYPPGYPPHNKYNDPLGIGGNLSDLGITMETPSGPTYAPAQPTNTVDTNPQGNDVLGTNAAAGIPLIGNIPGLSTLLGGGALP